VSSKRVDSQQRQPTPADGEHDALEESSEIHEALSLAKRDTGKDERNREQDTGYHRVACVSFRQARQDLVPGEPEQPGPSSSRTSACGRSRPSRKLRDASAPGSRSPCCRGAVCSGRKEGSHLVQAAGRNVVDEAANL